MMTWSNEPLAYCANVHPGATWEEAKANLRRFAPEIQKCVGRPIGVGLWLPNSALADLLEAAGEIKGLQSWLADNAIVVSTMNGFPFGDFHARRVKDNVYRPNWATSERLDYTCRVANLLALLLPENGEGSVSTLPLAFAPHHPMDRDTSMYRKLLVDAARCLHDLKNRTGRTIRLAIEPEPGCVLETTPQAIAFFESLWRGSKDTPDQAAVREHIGLCYDVCHQAVEYEDAALSIAALERAGIRIAKVQLSCALELTDPADDDARRELASFAEERYLHQTYAMHPSGRLLKRLDLTEEHAASPGAEWLDCRNWRIHFHVPVDKTSIGRLATTRPQLEAALEAVGALPYAPQLEVETYTWGVLPPEGDPSPNLVDGIAAELMSVQQWLTRPRPLPLVDEATPKSKIQNPKCSHGNAE